jgi:hypothetical protein
MSIAKSPKRIIIPPEILRSSNLFFIKKLPTKEAETPRVTKTVEKPRTNKILGMRILLIFPFVASSFISAHVSFETIDIYPGISGSTQGDTNETTPAKNAKTQLTSATEELISLIP